MHRWLGARIQYLQSVNNGDTVVLHYAIDIDMHQPHKQFWFSLKTRKIPHGLPPHNDVINGNIFRVTGHLCGNSPVPVEFPTQRPVTRSFDVFCDLRPNKRLSKQSWGWWSETSSSSLWRHRNECIWWPHGMETISASQAPYEGSTGFPITEGQQCRALMFSLLAWLICWTTVEGPMPWKLWNPYVITPMMRTVINGVIWWWCQSMGYYVSWITFSMNPFAWLEWKWYHITHREIKR